MIKSNENQINDSYRIHRIVSINFLLNQVCVFFLNFYFNSLVFILILMKIFNETKEIEELINLSEKHSIIFNEILTLKDLSKEHLINLHQSLIHSSSSNLKLNSKLIIENDLFQWYQMIIDCDQKIIDLNSNSIYDLVQSLYLRGIYFHSKQMIKVIQYEQEINLSSKQISNDLFIQQFIINDWKQLLSIWIRIHQKLLKNSTNSIIYFLHLPSILTKLFQEKINL